MRSYALRSAASRSPMERILSSSSDPPPVYCTGCVVVAGSPSFAGCCADVGEEEDDDDDDDDEKKDEEQPAARNTTSEECEGPQRARVALAESGTVRRRPSILRKRFLFFPLHQETKPSHPNPILEGALPPRLARVTPRPISIAEPSFQGLSTGELPFPQLNL